jgi:hypothetical protein
MQFLRVSIPLMQMVNNPALLMIDPLMGKFNPGLKESFTSDTMEKYPLPLGDLVKDPLTHHPWWMYQTIYFHHLLHLHPDHPHTVDPQKFRSQNSGRPCSQDYDHHQGNSSIIQEGSNREEEESAKSSGGDSSSDQAISITGIPHLHIYHVHANNGQLNASYSMGLTIRHTAVDLPNDERGNSIRVWYSNPQ